jgi:hypothetical protein
MVSNASEPQIRVAMVNQSDKNEKGAAAARPRPRQG